MALSLSFQYRMNGQPDVHPINSLPMPMVYEDVPLRPAQWEYHVLSIDAREEALPDAQVLSDLGRGGWLLISAVEQHTQVGSSFVHYYFVRQKME
jgi:hypothetical protein